MTIRRLTSHKTAATGFFLVSLVATAVAGDSKDMPGQKPSGKAPEASPLVSIANPTKIVAGDKASLLRAHFPGGSLDQAGIVDWQILSPQRLMVPGQAWLGFDNAEVYDSQTNTLRLYSGSWGLLRIKFQPRDAGSLFLLTANVRWRTARPGRVTFEYSFNGETVFWGHPAVPRTDGADAVSLAMGPLTAGIQEVTLRCSSPETDWSIVSVEFNQVR